MLGRALGGRRRARNTPIHPHVRPSVRPRDSRASKGENLTTTTPTTTGGCSVDARCVALSRRRCGAPSTFGCGKKRPWRVRGGPLCKSLTWRDSGRHYGFVCRFVFRRPRSARAREDGRADDRDGWKARERRGDGDGDCEIGGARRARRVGFVDAKEEEASRLTDFFWTAIESDARLGVFTRSASASRAVGRVCARCGWFVRMISLREARRRFPRRIRRSPRDGSSRREADRAEAPV